MNGITHDAIARMLPTESNRKNTLDITLKREAGSVRIPTRQVQKLPLSTGIASIGFRPPGGKIQSQGRPLNTPSHGGNPTEWRNYFECER